MEGVNQISSGPRLGLVAMPFVELMVHGELSWHCRERVAEALHQTIVHWKSMEAERRMFEQRAACGQQSSEEGKHGS